MACRLLKYAQYSRVQRRISNRFCCVERKRYLEHEIGFLACHKTDLQKMAATYYI